MRQAYTSVAKEKLGGASMLEARKWKWWKEIVSLWSWSHLQAQWKGHHSIWKPSRPFAFLGASWKHHDQARHHANAVLAFARRTRSTLKFFTRIEMGPWGLIRKVRMRSPWGVQASKLECEGMLCAHTAGSWRHSLRPCRSSGCVRAQQLQLSSAAQQESQRLRLTLARSRQGGHGKADPLAKHLAEDLDLPMGHARKLFWNLQGSRYMQDRSIGKDRVLVRCEIKAGAIWSKQANATWEKCVEHAPTRTWYSWNQVVQFQKTSASTTDIHTTMKYPTLVRHGFIENDKLWGNSTEGWLHLFEVFGRAYLSSSWPAHQPWQRPGVSRSSNLRQLPGRLHGTHRLSQAMPRESCWNVDVFNFFKLKADIQWYSDFCPAALFSSSVSKLWSMPGCVCIGKVALASNTTTTNVVKSGPDQMGLAQQWSVSLPHWHCFWSDAKNSFRRWSGNSETP